MPWASTAGDGDAARNALRDDFTRRWLSSGTPAPIPRNAAYIIDSIRLATAALAAGVRAGWQPSRPVANASCFNVSAGGTTLAPQFVSDTPVRGLTGLVSFPSTGCEREAMSVTVSDFRPRVSGRLFDPVAVIARGGYVTPSAPAIVWATGTLNSPADGELLRGLAIRTLGAVQAPFMNVRGAAPASLCSRHGQ
jgi:hypothetical protein